MKSLFFQQSFESLSIRDLLKARDIFHYQLINKENVVATAIGLYRIRKADPWPSAVKQEVTGTKGVRTLSNSEIRPYSWPCIYVFVEKWEDENTLASRSPHSLVPKTLYLPDGQMVPVCIIEAKRELIEGDISVDAVSITPENFYAPGTLLVNKDGQGLRRMATAGCMVRDGQRYYMMTNNHALGKHGHAIFALTRKGDKKIGETATKNICRLPVSEVYPGFASTNQYLQMDIGLVEVDDVLEWKTAVPGLPGECGDVVDLYDQNLSLRLIGHKVVGKGGVSGIVRGEIQGLFYRYKAMGGYEYLCDFLIGPESDSDGSKLSIHHGDSGTLLYIEQAKAQADGTAENIYYPLAVVWGRHQFQDGLDGKVEPFAMATALSTVLNILDLDFVSDINSDESFIWGYIGHYAIGRQLSDTLDMITDPKLKSFLTANADKISMKSIDIRNVAKSPRPLDGEGDSFVPLADVPDNVWKGNVNFKNVKLPDGSSKRQIGPGSRDRDDNPNHFADIDLPFSGNSIPGIDGKTLLELSISDPDKYLKPDFWLDFYEAPPIKDQYEKWHKEQADPSKHYYPEKKGAHWGALPFRVWQLYDIMVKAAKANKPDEFLCAGGVLVHYLGDACQPLHCSYMSQGDPNQLKPYTKQDGTHMQKMVADGVHAGYEDNMVNAKDSIKEIMDKLPGVIAAQDDLIPAINSGFEAAKALIALVDATRKTLAPQKIIDKWVAVQALKASERNGAMWEELGDRTITCMARGSRYLAAIWESAWHADGENRITSVNVTTEALQKLYESRDFAPSVPLDQYPALLNIH